MVKAKDKWVGNNGWVVAGGSIGCGYWGLGGRGDGRKGRGSEMRWRRL